MSAHDILADEESVIFEALQTPKACLVWDSPWNLKSHYLPKSLESKKRPCLRTGAPYQILPSARHREGAEGMGVILGYFHIFTIFRPDLLGRHLEQHWGRVSDGWFKSPYRAWSLGPIRPLSAALRHNCGGALWKRWYIWICFFLSNEDLDGS